MSDRYFEAMPHLPKNEFEDLKQKVLQGLEQSVIEHSGGTGESQEAKKLKREAIARLEAVRKQLKLLEYDRRLPNPDSVNTLKVLREIGLPSEIIRSWSVLRKQVEQDLSVTYKKDIADSDLDELAKEGRGAYIHHQVNLPAQRRRFLPFLSFGSSQGTDTNLDVTNYVKGIGAHSLLAENKESDALWHAFPRAGERLFYDETTGLNGHPRIMGTETKPWGIHEHINAALLLGTALEVFNINSLSEAIERGIPVPIGVKEHTDLSLHLQSELAEKAKKSNNAFEKRNLTWLGNWLPFVSLATVVPGEKRFLRVASIIREGDQEKRLNDAQKLIDQKRMTDLAKMRIRQLQAGVTFSSVSSHAQNFYNAPDALLPIADYSDLIFLGGLQEKITGSLSDIMQIFFTQKNVGIKLTSDLRQLATVYSSLSVTDGLRPLHTPVTELNIGYQSVVDVNALYWQELFGKGTEEVNEDVGVASLYLKDIWNLAAAQHILGKIDKSKKKSWKKYASKQPQLFKALDESGLLLDTHTDRIDAFVSDYFVGETIYPLARTKEVQRVLNFIDTNDTSQLEELGPFNKVLMIGRTIHQIKDDVIRTRLSEAFIAFQSKRDMVDLLLEDEHHDEIYLFEDLHYDRVLKFIEDEDFETAEKTLTALSDLTSLNCDESDWHRASSDKLSTKMFLLERLVSADKTEVSEIAEHAKYHKQMTELFKGAAGNVFFNAFTDDEMDIFDFASENNLPSLRTIMINIMSSLGMDQKVRHFITEYLERYQSIVDSHRMTMVEDPTSLIAELDELVDEMGEIVPMLRIAHDMNLVNAYRQSDDTASAQERFSKVKKVYSEIDFDRWLTISGWKESYDLHKAKVDWAEHYLDKGRYHQEKGMLRLAEYYRNLGEERKKLMARSSKDD